MLVGEALLEMRAFQSQWHPKGWEGATGNTLHTILGWSSGKWKDPDMGMSLVFVPMAGYLLALGAVILCSVELCAVGWRVPCRMLASLTPPTKCQWCHSLYLAVTAVNNPVLLIESCWASRSQKLSSQEKKFCNHVWWWMLTKRMVIISQYTQICSTPKMNTIIILHLNFIKRKTALSHIPDTPSPPRG